MPPCVMRCLSRRRSAESRLLGGCRHVNSVSVPSIKEAQTDSRPIQNEILIETPFLIVGAGPVGTALSNLLGHLHVPHVLVDRRSSIEAISNSASQAHFLSNRSMESQWSF